MENFKGTKGKWWVSGRDLMGEIHIKIAKFDPTDIKYQEHKYNLLLTSKAPEMLTELQSKLSFIEHISMLIPSNEWTESFRDEFNKEMHYLEKLIKQATEL
jgi:hypothetical protein